MHAAKVLVPILLMFYRRASRSLYQSPLQPIFGHHATLKTAAKKTVFSLAPWSFSSPDRGMSPMILNKYRLATAYFTSNWLSVPLTPFLQLALASAYKTALIPENTLRFNKIWIVKCDNLLNNKIRYLILQFSQIVAVSMWPGIEVILNRFRTNFTANANSRIYIWFRS